MAVKQVPLMLSVPKECRDRLRQMAAERNLQNPNKVIAASTIARDFLVEFLSKIESQAVHRE
jgi:hypothetical protein